MTSTARQQAKDRIASNMDATELSQIKRIKEMRARHISSKRDAEILALYNKLRRNTQIETEKLAGLVITGIAGSGKTHLIRSMQSLPDFQPYRVPEEPDFDMLPYITIDAPPKAAPNQLLAAIVGACGFPIAQPGNVAEMITIAMRWFERRRVMFVHIDEFQHALRTGTENQIKDIQDTIKQLIQIDADWPIQIILSGTPQVLSFRKTNPELSGRTIPFPLDGLSPSKDTALLEKIALGIITEHARLTHVGLGDSDFLQRLLKSANYQFGSFVTFVRLACEEVILKGEEVVAVEHFARVYTMLSGDRDPETNLFLSPNWSNIQLPEGMINGTAFQKATKRKLRTFQV